jgi:hypothetical protein
MNTFTKKSLYLALFGAAAIASSPSQAINVSPDGLGMVLIYPYYTVNKDVNGNSFNTLLSIVNTTGSTKAVKVRFREGRESVEVLDFNVFLSDLDVWTATLTPTAAGGAHITTTDKSCTIPTFPAGGQDFLSAAYATEKDNSITRTAEGYFEVFEMATYDPNSGVVGPNSHKSKDCSKINDVVAGNEANPPAGGLFGNAIIINPFGGGAFSESATALDNASVGGYFPTTSASPTYSDIAPAVSNVIVGDFLYQSEWADSIEATTAVLMANAVANEYVLDPGAKAQTSWVLTQPTKFLLVDSTGASPPYTSKYVDGKGGCETSFLVWTDREEAQPQSVQGFSPNVSNPAVICWEANLINFRQTASTDAAANIFGSNNANTIVTDGPPSTAGSFQNGWAVVAFNTASGAATDTLHTLGPPEVFSQSVQLSNGAVVLDAPIFFGLPVIGFAAEAFNNPALTIAGKTFLSTFGATFPHRPLKVVVED